MADELQGLLDRITNEGLKKAEAKQREIVEAAQAEARRIVKAAQAEAAETVAKARQEADLLREKSERSLRQAARDLLLSLRCELESRVSAVARELVASTLDGQALAAAVADLIRLFAERDGAESRFEVLLGEEQLGAVREALESALAKDLRARVDLVPVAGLRGGFKLAFTGKDILYDFSDEALGEALTTFLSPRLAEILNGGGA